MKKALKKKTSVIYHYKDGVRVDGAPDTVSGNLSGIHGNLTYIRGDLTGIRGDLTGIRGNIDDCELTDEDRERGVDISELVG